jgi:hypothetical protein
MREDPLAMRESVRGDGKLCGAIFLDENFVRLVESKIGAAEWRRYSRKAVRKFLNDQWEHAIKKEFDADDEDSYGAWTVQLPSAGSTQSGVRDRDLMFTQ